MRRNVLPVILLVMLASCSTQSKLNSIRKTATSARLTLADDYELPEIDYQSTKRDTLKVEDDQGREILIMRAVLDEDGQMVATDEIVAAKVTARFRNVAERHGKVDLSFDVTVPKLLQDSKWQLRFNPTLTMLGETIGLEPILITGSSYRKAQLRGYQQYNKFLSSIITDSTKFQFAHQLEVFIQRNLPEVYRFKGDTSFVSDEMFESFYGITEKRAVEHYTNWILVRHNERKIAMKDRMYRKYVKAPMISEGLRLDTVLTGNGNEIVYRYIQTINARPGLKRADISLSGDIYEYGKVISSIPPTEPLTFYISSLNAFVDNNERYLTMVIERKADANATCFIDFEKGKTEVDPNYRDNAEEIQNVKGYLSSLMKNETYDLDSIIVTASSSPEGNESLNRRLSLRRSESVSKLFEGYLGEIRDSLMSEHGVFLSLEGNVMEKETVEIPFISRSNGENWDLLRRIVERDSLMTGVQRGRFMELMIIQDVDKREEGMKKEDFYPHLYDSHYPKLRNVRFDFHLHRKGMVKDSLHTTVLDTTYMRGVEALQDGEYQKAVEILGAYADFNAAVAYCAMDYNASAMDILSRLPRTDKTEYLKAIVHSRIGNVQEAVQCYLNACSMNKSFISRGNLDPEISELIRKYNLNKDTEQ